MRREEGEYFPTRRLRAQGEEEERGERGRGESDVVYVVFLPPPL